MSVSGVGASNPQFQAAIAQKTREQQPEGAEPAAEKALDGTNAQLQAVIGSLSSGLDISV